MSTWWLPARRADLGLNAGDLPVRSFAVTNRGWYVLHRLLGSLRARRQEQLAGDNVYIPTQLAQHWGNAVLAADYDSWYQIGRYDGKAVVTAGIAIGPDEVSGEDFELTPLSGTPLGAWLFQLGQDLATTSTGLVITGQPRKDNSMTVNLSKGGKVDLGKEAGGTLTKVRIGLGWDVRRTDGQAYDLDASVIAVGADGACLGTDWFVFYNNRKAPGDVIVHQGDNLTGSGDGDDEQVVVDLAQLPDKAQELVVAVTIHEARQRGGQSFGLVENAFVRVMDESTGTELARYDLTEDTEPGVNCLVFGKLYRRDGSWNFRALGDGFKDELGGLVTAYKIG